MGHGKGDGVQLQISAKGLGSPAKGEAPLSEGNFLVVVPAVLCDEREGDAEAVLSLDSSIIMMGLVKSRSTETARPLTVVVAPFPLLVTVLFPVELPSEAVSSLFSQQSRGESSQHWVMALGEPSKTAGVPSPMQVANLPSEGVSMDHF